MMPDVTAAELAEWLVALDRRLAALEHRQAAAEKPATVNPVTRPVNPINPAHFTQPATPQAGDVVVSAKPVIIMLRPSTPEAFCAMMETLTLDTRIDQQRMRDDLIRRNERERCARIAEQQHAFSIASAIRPPHQEPPRDE